MNLDESCTNRDGTSERVCTHTRGRHNINKNTYDVILNSSCKNCPCPRFRKEEYQENIYPYSHINIRRGEGE